MKTARLRPQAEHDLVANARYPVRESGMSAGAKAFNAALAAFRPIERMPGLGSLRLGLLCEIPELRSWV